MLLRSILSFIPFALFLIASSHNTDDQVLSSIDYGSFEDPSAYVRPRFRYWIPDASVDLSIVTDDFAKAKDVGMGGLELLGYYIYGDYPSVIAEGGPVPVDWTKYGWGTEAWKELMVAALKAAKANGMVMDFANGPNQGAGVPAKPDDEGLMWDLVPYNASVPIGGTFDDALPGWGAGTFVSASTALVTSSEPSTFYALPAWQGPYFYNGTTQTLDVATLEDVTDQVDENGYLILKFPTNVSNGLHYEVFAYYQNHSGYREQASPLELNPGSIQQSAVDTFVQNGSWVVDHFSAKGAQAIIDFWEHYLLDDEALQLIKEVGNYAWEDSEEIGAGALAWWTPDLLETFKSSRGYDLNKYLPLIYSYNTEANGPLASPDHFYTNQVDGGQRYVNDYWQTLTELNQIYLQTLTNWSQSSLESQFSAQVVYNLPMDMLASIPSVNAPECESLGFNHIIDAYRQFSGPANLAGKRVISSELGAQPDEVYSQTMPELIWDTKRSVAGGINQFVYHGYPYTGSYPNTTWPGYTTFTYRFSNMHGPRQPGWEHYQDFMDWTARVQWVAQSGVPKADLAFWLKRDQYFSVPSVYEPNDLAEAGFSYEYLSPDNFGLPEAVVEDGVLAPTRQAFKAMIVRQNDTLTVSGVQKLVEFAQEGLSIVFSGGVPQNLTGYNITGTEYVRSALASILDLENVHIVPFENLASSLSALGITSRTTVNADRIWYTYWREDTSAARSYVFVYNDAWDSELGSGSSTGAITLETTGVPYMYDALTGQQDPILAYQQTSTTTTIPLQLAGNQSIIVAFHTDETMPTGTRLLATPSAVFSATSASGIVTIKAGNTSEPALLSNGTAVTLPIPDAPMELKGWNLTIESWTQPKDPATDQTVSAKANSTYQSDELKPWKDIDASLRHVSGRGFYTTSFSWPPKNGSGGADGAILDLGVIFNTARVWVNGNQLPPLDPTAAWSDIGDLLQVGDNEVEVVVTTTLGNALIPLYDEGPEKIKTSGTTWLGPRPLEQEYGLVVPVRVVPYRSTAVGV